MTLEGAWLFGERGLLAVDRPTLIIATTEDTDCAFRQSYEKERSMMKPSRIVAIILVVGAGLGLLTGCTASRDIVLTFDGEACHYEGPDVVTEGEVTITLVNESDLEASLWMVRLDEGKTWQELLDYIGPPGSSVEPPAWSSGDFIASKLPDKSNTTVYTLNEGLFGICCCTCNELFEQNRGVWPGALLEVRAR